MFLTCWSLFMGAIYVMTEWITERCHLRRALEGAFKVEKDLVLGGGGGLPTAGAASPVLGTYQPEPHWSQLWGDFLPRMTCLTLRCLKTSSFLAPSKNSEEKMFSSSCSPSLLHQRADCTANENSGC